MFQGRCNHDVHHSVLPVHPVPNSINITRAGPILTQMPGLDKDGGYREDTADRGRGRQNHALDNQLEDFMRLESAPVPPTPPRVALPGEDAVWSGGVLSKIPEGD